MCVCGFFPLCFVSFKILVVLDHIILSAYCMRTKIYTGFSAMENNKYNINIYGRVTYQQ